MKLTSFQKIAAQAMGVALIASVASPLARATELKTQNDPLNAGAGQINSTAVPMKADYEILCARLEESKQNFVSYKSEDGKSVVKRDLRKDCVTADPNDKQLLNFCMLRDAAVNGQAGYYCKARAEAKKVKRSLAIVAALDAAATVTCLTEALTANKKEMTCKKAIETRETGEQAAYDLWNQACKAKIARDDAVKANAPNADELAREYTQAENAASFASTEAEAARLRSTAACQQDKWFRTGVCGGAAFAAGAAEFARILATQDQKTDMGDYKVDASTGEGKERKGFGQVGRIVAGAAVGVEGMRIAACYYQVGGICKSGNEGTTAGTITKSLGFSSATCRGGETPESQSIGYADVTNRGCKMPVASMQQEPPKVCDQDKVRQKEIHARGRLAKEASAVFGVLGAIRGYNIIKVGKTKKDSEAALDLLYSKNTAAISSSMMMAAAGGVGGAAVAGATSGTAGTSSSSKAPISTGDGYGNAEFANAVANSPESVLLPKGGETAKEVEKNLNTMAMDDQSIDRALSSGDAGGVIATATSGIPGGTDIAGLGRQVASYMAGMSDTGSAYAGGGGHRAAGGDEEKGLDLNLGALFGKTEEGGTIANAGLATYRGPAAADELDIWHQNSPRSLFQIISRRYEFVNERWK